MSNKDIKCPHCGLDQDICHDDGQGYDDNDYNEQECLCGKTITFSVAILYLYEVIKES